ncbi:NfeD family protein [Sphingobacterium spiritivorum]|uniref:ATP synthase F0, A subunit n=1 Tax=Sphingobacterium spiritivorum ATCC 33861 TaxID=525373 RepID=D7VMC0_SPHSI|nr:NfeD family protein [Sphingobacterium spiritivorum]EFK58125.1 putative ATP synthase F0, A subunit [Sphingobacterium spiritivorum ATCC 33861]WQD35499.1 NfeD family protein [Sphingobacterium spiritivorum]
MNKFTKTFLTILFLMSCFAITAVQAQEVYHVRIHDEIGPAAWRTFDKATKRASELKSAYLLVELNTFGGAVNYADSIRSRLLNSPMKTVVYINHNAASAGALIAMASDYIYMQKGASIGAASVVDAKGEVLPEKYQSYMRGLMRATAEAKGRDPKIAEAFVDPSVSIPNLKPDGKLLTMTADEAVKAGVAKAEVSANKEIFIDLGIRKPTVTVHEVGMIDNIIGFLINPVVSGALILLIIGGIYAEMQTPGIGFALAVALIAGALFFAPLYMEGLAAHWEIALFFIGVILIALEIFVIPGFGVTGILGIICLVCGLAFSMVSNDYFDFKLAHPGMLFNSFLIVIGSMFLAVILMVIFGKNILKSSAFKRLVLEDEQKSDQGYTSSVSKADLLHKQGVAKTVLRPSGKIEIDGVWYDAVALDGFIDAGDLIYVEKHENYNLFVRKIEELKG